MRSSASKTSIGRRWVVPWIRLPATSLVHRRRRSFAASMSSPSGSVATKLLPTYFTPASTLPFFSGSRGGAGSTLKP